MLLAAIGVSGELQGRRILSMKRHTIASGGASHFRKDVLPLNQEFGISAYHLDC